MDRLVYTAYSGLKGRMAAQAAIANNMANASTIGFRADRISFEKAALGGAGFEARAMTSEQVVDADRKAGASISTGRDLDVTVNGDDWLAVQADDGEEAYTRRGDLSIAPSGVLQTGDGHPVMGSNGSPITIPPAAKVTISPEGAILIVPPGGDADKPQPIDKLKLVDTKGSDTVKGIDNLLRVKGGGALPANLDAKVTTGALEQSNVNITDALIQMIENQRGYEVQAKLLSSAKDIDTDGASLMRLNQ